MKTELPSLIHKQKGVAILTFSIILLIVLTLLGASAIDLSSIELRQTRSLIEYNRAFQIAETALQKYIKTYKENVNKIPNITNNKEICIIASYKDTTQTPRCNVFNIDTTLQMGVDYNNDGTPDGGAEIYLKRSKKTNGIQHLVIQSIGYTRGYDNPKTFKVILEAGLKFATLAGSGSGLTQ